MHVAQTNLRWADELLERGSGAHQHQPKAGCIIAPLFQYRHVAFIHVCPQRSWLPISPQRADTSCQSSPSVFELKLEVVGIGIEYRARCPCVPAIPTIKDTSAVRIRR